MVMLSGFVKQVRRIVRVRLMFSVKGCMAIERTGMPLENCVPIG